MPIDIKWVRNHPGIVKEWQRVRGRQESGHGTNEQGKGHDRDQDPLNRGRLTECSEAHSNDHDDLVDLCVLYDNITRRDLQKLEDMKRQLNNIQRQLRPKTASSSSSSTAGYDPIPSVAPVDTTSKERLLQERKELQDQIVIQQKTYEESCRKTNQALWGLASPVDLEVGDDVNDDDDDDCRSLDLDLNLELVESDLYRSHENTNIGNKGSSETINTFSSQHQEQPLDQLERAFIEYTSHFFNSYNQIAVPDGKILVEDDHIIESSTSILVDRRTDPSEEKRPSSKFPLKPSSSHCYDTSPTISHDDACALWGYFSEDRRCPRDNKVKCLPTWVRLLTDYNNSSSSSNSKRSKNTKNSTGTTTTTKKRSIWGDKQLPAYAAIWGDNYKSFDIVVLTASSLVDARIIRNRLVHDLKNFFESLLILNTTHDTGNDCGGDGNIKCTANYEIKNENNGLQKQMKCFLRRVPPDELECHEWSRIEIWVEIIEGIRKHKLETDPRFWVGSVSHWGDAISRAHEMVFASGGKPSGKHKQMNEYGSREYVHIIQAAVVDDQTWKKIICCHTTLSLTSVNNDGGERTSIDPNHQNLPPAVRQIFERLSSKSVEENEAILHSVLPHHFRLGVQSIFGPLKNNENSKNSELKMTQGHGIITGTVSTKNESSKADRETSTMNPDGDEQFWREDDWTKEDEKKAEQVLSQNLAKCRISRPLPMVGNDRASLSSSSEALSWDIFYQTHETKFFKDRHYLAKSFPEEFGEHNGTTTDNGCTDKGKTIVEIGCGVGNAILPLLEKDNKDGSPQWSIVHGLDISPEAIRLLQNDSRFIAFNSHKIRGQGVYGHVCDIAKEPLPPSCVDAADVTSMLFCLSAIDPIMHPTAVMTAAGSLKGGGTLVFRDYGRYDEAQMKLGTSRSKLIKDNFYCKSDGTKCYYFTLDDLKSLFVDYAGLEAIEVKTLRRAYPNKATGQERRRVWVQGRFRKPIITP